MIETQFFILGNQEFVKAKHDANELGVSVDYFLLEFCAIDGDWVEVAE